ncbi:MAG: nicotinamide riboside transporter PnuC [Ferruginibacter sp.]
MKFFFNLILICFLQTGYATTYYVSTTGNDITGNGSVSNPWKTLHKATKMVTTRGDIIHVKAGVYTETVQVVLAAGVSIEGEGETTVIQSTLTQDWIELLSLRSPEGTDGNQEISNLKFDGQNLSTSWGIAISGRSNVSIHDCIIVDFNDRGVIYSGRNDNEETAPEIFATGNKFYNNILSNCAAYTTPNGIYGRGCLNIGGQDGMLIYNNKIIQNQRPKGYNGFPIKYSNDGYLKGVKIYNNVITKIPFKGNYGGDNGWDFAIEFWNVLGGMEIYGNTIQGAVDFVKTSKNEYDYGVWFHDNTVGQQALNKYFESGLIFEVFTESVLIEKNIFNKLAGGILFYTEGNRSITDVTIRENRFENIGKKTGNGNNGNGINLNCGVILRDEIRYAVNNLSIYNNSITAAAGNAPLYGIEISGAESVDKITIRNNSIKNFNVAAVFANPGFVIDSLLVEGNTLSGNGNNNKPFFIRGGPDNFIYKKNVESKDSSGVNPGFNFKQQLIRPVYYELKNFSMVEYIFFLAVFVSCWFCSREHIYTFIPAVFASVIYLFTSLEKNLLAEAFTAFYFITMCVYGWLVWKKRDRRRHRVVRITASSRKEMINQLAFFAGSFAVLLLMRFFLSQNFVFGTVAVTDVLVSACAVTGMLLITRKKTESWYWWITGFALATALFYIKHYILYSVISLSLLLLTGWCLYIWKKKANKKEKQTIKI